MSKLQSDNWSAVRGYLLIIVCQYSILILLAVISIQFNKNEPAKYQGIWWVEAVSEVIVWLLIIGIPVAVGHYFGRVSYVGVALCMVFCFVIPFQLFLYYSLSQLAPGGTVTLGSPWYNYLFPSLIAVIALYVWRSISNHSSGHTQADGR